MATMTSSALSTKWNLKSHVTRLWGRVGCGVWGEYFLPSLDSTQTFSLDTHYNMQNKYFWTGFHKWPNTLSWGEYFLPSLDSTQTFSLDTHYNTQNKYIWTGFHKWPNTSSWGSVRIPTRNLYAVTQHLHTRRNFIFLNSPRGFRRSLEERSHNFKSQLPPHQPCRAYQRHGPRRLHRPWHQQLDTHNVDT